MLHYEVLTTNKTKEWLVFCHGFGGNSNIWYKQVNHFKEHFNLLFIDLRGHGGSYDVEPKFKKYTSEKIAEDVIKVLNHLKIVKAHFMGISLGTIVIHSLYAISPERIKSMVMAGSVIEFKRFSRILLELGDILKFTLPYMWIYKLFAWIMMPNKHHKKSRDIFIREAKKLCQKEFIKWYKFIKNSSGIYKQTINSKKLPKIYIMGGEDYMFIDSTRENIAQDSEAVLHVIEGVGHVCNIEGFEEFNEVSLKFLKDQENKSVQNNIV